MRSRCLSVGVGMLFVAGAIAQQDAAPVELTNLYSKLTKPGAVHSPEEAKDALEFLSSWRVDPAKLTATDRAKLLSCEAIAAAAGGDAARALRAARAIRAEFPAELAYAEPAYLGAFVAADAELAGQIVKTLAETASPDAKKRLARQRQFIAPMGKQAPDVTIRSDDGPEFAVRKRKDKLLIIDFWNVLSPPADAQVDAMLALHAEFGGESHVEFVGVNSDNEQRTPKARDFAAQKKYTWPQRYEQKAVGAPITHEAFKAGAPPWIVVVDAIGQLRAVGEPGDAALTYAIRCALAEARGEHDAMSADRRSGKKPDAAGDSPTAQKPAAKPAGGDAELPSNPDAAAKLNRARLFFKTGKKTDARKLAEEVVREYPGTREAKEAQEWLDSIG